MTTPSNIFLSEHTEFQLSIIIVHYRVPFFLEQCLFSIERASVDLRVEVLVVNNDESPNSLDFIQSKFPEVQFFHFGENLGFSKGCNRALQVAKGEYILFLNPDTLLQEGTLRNCLHFFSTPPQQSIGALTVHMTDGKGVYLPESKRAVPDARTAFFKMCGLHKLFPQSSYFARYYLGHLPQDGTHPIEVLCGAFMMIPRTVLQKVGSFDEQFFMYGEDIDLSYRILQAGFHNYYLGKEKIIHFKGESTKKGSLNYVRLFYSAMDIFVQKHYTGAKGKWFQFFLRGGILFRAAAAIGKRWIQTLALPVVDLALTYGAYRMAFFFWQKWMRPETRYLPEHIATGAAVTALVLLVVFVFSGWYDKKLRMQNTPQALMGVVVGSLTIYSLFPENWRFSRGMVLLASATAVVCAFLWRIVLLKRSQKSFFQENKGPQHILLIGEKQDANSVKLKWSDQWKALDKTCLIDEWPERVKEEIAIEDSVHSIQEKIQQYPVSEVVYSVGKMKMKAVQAIIRQLRKEEIQCWITHTESNSLVSSESAHKSGESFGNYADTILYSDPAAQRSKRLFDVVSSLLLLLSAWVWLFYSRKQMSKVNRGLALRRCWWVFTGQYTWVGASHPKFQPQIKKQGVLCTAGTIPESLLALSATERLNNDVHYLKNQHYKLDLIILWRNLRWLGYTGITLQKTYEPINTNAAG